MEHQQRAKKLERINITELLNSIFNHSVSLVNMGNDELERNRVYLIKEYNYILKIYGDNSRWRNEIKFISKLNKCSFRVPEVITFGMFENVGWVIIEKLQGDLLIDKYNESSCVNGKRFCCFFDIFDCCKIGISECCFFGRPNYTYSLNKCSLFSNL